MQNTSNYLPDAKVDKSFSANFMLRLILLLSLATLPGCSSIYDYLASLFGNSKTITANEEIHSPENLVLNSNPDVNKDIIQNDLNADLDVAPVLGSDLNSNRHTASIANPQNYMEGDSFLFNNPFQVTVVRKQSGDKVEWQSDNNQQFSTSSKLFMIALEWEDNNTNFKRSVSKVEGSLFPMQAGAKVSFLTNVSADKPPHNWAQSKWFCEASSSVKKTVPAGSFKTFPITCNKDGQKQLVLFYAPQLGHFVHIDHLQNGNDWHSRSLVAASRIGQDPIGLTAEAWSPTDGIEINNLTSAVMEPNQDLEENTVLSQDNLSIQPNLIAETRQLAAATTPNRITVNELLYNASVDGDNVEEGSEYNAIVNSKLKNNSNSTLFKPEQIVAAHASNNVNLKTNDENYLIHLASYKDVSNAKRGWQVLNNRFPTVLNGSDSILKKHDLGEKGIFYRLYAKTQTGSKATAKQVCKVLISKTWSYCQITKS